MTKSNETDFYSIASSRPFGFCSWSNQLLVILDTYTTVKLVSSPFRPSIIASRPSSPKGEPKFENNIIFFSNFLPLKKIKKLFYKPYKYIVITSVEAIMVLLMFRQTHFPQKLFAPTHVKLGLI